MSDWYEAYIEKEKAHEKSKKEERENMEKMKGEYLNIYIQEPVEKDSMAVLCKMHEEATIRHFYLDEEFYKEFFHALNDRKMKLKFLKEIFAFQFIDVKRKSTYKDLVRIIGSSQTFKIAALNYKNGNHKFIQNFILNTLDLIEKGVDIDSQEKEKKSDKNKYYNSEAEENWSSDVIYWEAVHDGEIIPEENNDSSYFDYIGDDFCDSYSYDKLSVINELTNYLGFVEDCTLTSLNEKKEFMQKVGDKGIYEAHFVIRRLES